MAGELLMIYFCQPLTLPVEPQLPLLMVEIVSLDSVLGNRMITHGMGLQIEQWRKLTSHEIG
jgi:hypothetical protein